MSEIENLTEKVDRLTGSVDKLSDLVEKVAGMLVKQDTQERELKSTKETLDNEIKTRSELLSIETEQRHALNQKVAVLVESKKNDTDRINNLENAFNGVVKWLLGIAGTLIAAGIIGMIVLYGKVS